MDVSRRPFHDAACMLECIDEAYNAIIHDILEPDLAALSSGSGIIDSDTRYDLARALKAVLNRTYDAVESGADVSAVTVALFDCASVADELTVPTTFHTPLLPVAPPVRPISQR